MSVVLVSRDEAQLGVVAREVEALGVQAEVLAADLAVRSDVERVARRLASEASPVDVLVNNAGFGLRAGFLSSTDEELDEALDVMVRAVMILSHAAAAAMVPRGAGRIINVSSIASVIPGGSYSAHKAWVLAFSESLAVELRRTGVRVTAVCPGLVHTEFHARASLDFVGLPSAAWLTSPHVVRSALEGSRRGRVVVIPSARYGALWAAARMVPRAWIRRIAGGRARASRTKSGPQHGARG